MPVTMANLSIFVVLKKERFNLLNYWKIDKEKGMNIFSPSFFPPLQNYGA